MQGGKRQSFPELPPGDIRASAVTAPESRSLKSRGVAKCVTGLWGAGTLPRSPLGCTQVCARRRGGQSDTSSQGLSALKGRGAVAQSGPVPKDFRGPASSFLARPRQPPRALQSPPKRVGSQAVSGISFSSRGAGLERPSATVLAARPGESSWERVFPQS